VTATFEVLPFRAERTATIDTLRWARKRFGIPVLLEVDVTAARRALQAVRSTGITPSFTAWVVSCAARAAAEHPRVHALRQRRRLVLFRDVDVAIVVERQLHDNGSRETLPMPVVIRRANEKHFEEISEEIRRAQTVEVPKGVASIERRSKTWLQTMFFRGLPAVLRDLLFWRWLFASPQRIKRTMGTVMVTATGMTAPGVFGWGIPMSVHPLAVSVGGIAKRPTPMGDVDILALTLVFDHAVIDGAPFGRFVRRLHELLTTAPMTREPWKEVELQRSASPESHRVR
jgi:pyruvate/2-oxoglutarate dehydrogenase complex dihydrolipoamide acyltransferase (E2) component